MENDKPKKILIVGGSGYTGHPALAALKQLEDTHQIVIVGGSIHEDELKGRTIDMHWAGKYSPEDLREMQLGSHSVGHSVVDKLTFEEGAKRLTAAPMALKTIDRGDDSSKPNRAQRRAQEKRLKQQRKRYGKR